MPTTATLVGNERLMVTNLLDLVTIIITLFVHKTVLNREVVMGHRQGLEADLG